MSSFEFAIGQWWTGGKYPAALISFYVMVQVLMNAAENVFLTSFENGPWNLQSRVDKFEWKVGQIFNWFTTSNSLIAL